MKEKIIFLRSFLILLRFAQEKPPKSNKLWRKLFNIYNRAFFLSYLRHDSQRPTVYRNNGKKTPNPRLGCRSYDPFIVKTSVDFIAPLYLTRPVYRTFGSTFALTHVYSSPSSFSLDRIVDVHKNASFYSDVQPHSKEIHFAQSESSYIYV